jgi:hypothetical protein
MGSRKPSVKPETGPRPRYALAVRARTDGTSGRVDGQVMPNGPGKRSAGKALAAMEKACRKEKPSRLTHSGSAGTLG